MGFKPFQNELGQQLFDTICAVCWSDWLKTQQQLINHYALNLLDPGAKQFLIEHPEIMVELDDRIRRQLGLIPGADGDGDAGGDVADALGQPGDDDPILLND